MDQELTRLYHLLGAGLGNQCAGKGGKFPVGHHPPHYITAVNVEDDIEVVVGPLYRTLELRDIPTPCFARISGFAYWGRDTCLLLSFSSPSFSRTRYMVRTEQR
jgi:hypothetical protein